MTQHKYSGFSLVELSIVLVILGLLVGGVLSGQSLIRAAQLRAVTTEYMRFATASQTFRDKYFAIPGDFNNAQAFWGQSTSCSGGSATGTCNGNGDGIIGGGAGANLTSESTQYWRQLNLAGLIEGNYTGIAGSGGAYHCVIGTSCPPSKLTPAGWGIQTLGSYAGDGGFFVANYGHMLVFGGQSVNQYPIGKVLKPEEAWNIDTKLDDGRPATGRVLAVNWPTCTDAATFTTLGANYQLSDSGLDCSLAFAQAF